MVRFVEGFPVAEVQFTRDGHVHDRDAEAALHQHLRTARPERLLVFSHGWNNDMAEARSLYRRWLAGLRAAGTPTDATSVLAVLWPSKRFADADLVPSGAASLAVASPAVGEVRADVEAVRDALGLSDREVVLLRALADDLETDPAARTRFAELVLAHLEPDALAAEEGAGGLAAADPADVLERLAAPVLPTELDGAPPPGVASSAVAGDGADVADAAGGAAGGLGPRPDPVGAPPTADADGSAAGFGRLLGGLRGGARTLLNLTTYFAMKGRAGTVGTEGLAPILARVRRDMPDLALHLVGHSFGGRLVTATALGPDGADPLRVEGMVLLQAAFSHHGFASAVPGIGDGAFRRVLTEGRCAGPIVATHTANDRAVGLAYPLASRMGGHVASRLGDAGDRYGGIGRNGAVLTDEAVAGELTPSGASIPLVPGRVHNLHADGTIGSHMDVANGATAALVHELVTA